MRISHKDIGLTQFSYFQGRLLIWYGNCFQYASRYLKSGNLTIGNGHGTFLGFNIEKPDAAEWGGKRPVTAEDIDKFCHIDRKFTRWFEKLAIRGYIYGAAANSDRNSFFAIMADKGKPGVSVGRRKMVRQLNRHLGGAFWGGRGKDVMCFTGVVDGKILVGLLQKPDRTRHLKLKWLPNTESNRREYGFYSEREVPTRLYIGQR